MRSPRRGIRVFTAAAITAAAAGVCGLASPAAHAAPVVQNGPIYFGGGNWYAVNPDGSHKHVALPSGPTFNPTDSISAPVFSPDGTQAVFTDGATGGLMISNADGTNVRVLTDPNNGQGYNGSTNIADGDPSWLDNSTIVYARNSGTVYQIKADGTGQAVWNGPAGTVTGGIVAPVAFGPGGLVAIATSNQFGFTTTVYKPGAAAVTLNNVDGAQFSPDGTKIAYVAGSAGSHPQLTVANADNTTPTPLTSVTGLVYNAVWSPDGTQLAFNQQSGSVANLETVTVASGAVKVVAANTNAGGPVSWQNGPTCNGPDYWPAPYGPVPTKPTITRLGGANRVDTSVKVSGFNTPDWGTGYVDSAKTAVLSRSDQFADALSGNALAVAKNGPLLLTEPTSLNPEVATELTRILPKGATIYLLGGKNALSPAVESAVQALGFRTVRVAGNTRFETSVAIAKQIGGVPGSVAVATGVNYPDALTAGAGVRGNYNPFAATGRTSVGVVLLTQDGVLPQVTKDYLTTIDPTVSKVYGVGGQGVTALKTGMPGWIGKFTELAGTDRYDTAAKVANSAMFLPGAMVPGIATGANWPDALAGGALTGRWNSPLLLANGSSLPASELNWLTTNLAKNQGIPQALYGALPVFGGTAVVPDSVLTQVGDAVYGAGKYSVAVNPHLVPIPRP